MEHIVVYKNVSPFQEISSNFQKKKSEKKKEENYKGHIFKTLVFWVVGLAVLIFMSLLTFCWNDLSTYAAVASHSENALQNRMDYAFFWKQSQVPV